MQNTPFITVLVVSYNAEKYIEKTLQSCLSQTYLELEILVLDNASSDRTVEIIKNMNDSRITLFESKKNIGPYAGLNFLLDKAEGEYIAVQDHDDIWFPEKIAKQVEFLENNKDYIGCGTNTFYFYEKNAILILNKKPETADFVNHTSLMFRNVEFRYDLYHSLPDEHFEKKILAKKGKIACLQEGLTIHRIKGDGTNLSSSRFSLTFKQIQDFFSVNSFSFSTLFYLFDLISRKFFPESVLWFFRKKITLRNARWVSLDDFRKRFPEISL